MAINNVIITTMINSANKINIYYLDIIANQGIVDNGVYFDNLFLDVFVHAEGEIKIDDIEKLNKALDKNNITDKLFTLAMETKVKLE